MKNLATILSVLFLAALIAPAFSVFPEPTGLSEEDYYRLFTGSDVNIDEVLKDEEAEDVLVALVREVFKRNGYFEDEEMIHAIADELVLKHGLHYEREKFLPLALNVPSQIHTFRQRIYKDLIEAYNVKHIMDDKELAGEVYKNPDVYGLTYAAHRVLFFNIDAAAKEAGLAKRSLYQRFRDRAGNLAHRFTDRLDKSLERADTRAREIIGNGTMRVRDIYHHGVDAVHDLKEQPHLRIREQNEIRGNDRRVVEDVEPTSIPKFEHDRDDLVTDIHPIDDDIDERKRPHPKEIEL